MAAKQAACQVAWVAFSRATGHGAGQSRDGQSGRAGPDKQQQEYSCGLPAGTRR